MNFDFKRWATQKANRLEARSMKQQARRRNTLFYKNYFDGFEEFMYTDAKGHERLTLVYTAEYYKLKRSKAQKITTYISFGILWLAAAAAAVVGSVQYIGANSQAYTGILEMIMLGGLLFTLIGMISMYASPEIMLRRHYKESRYYIRIGSWIGIGAAASTIICIMVYYFCIRSSVAAEYRQTMLIEYLLTAALLAASAAILLILNRMNEHLEYEVIPNKHPDIPKGASRPDFN